MYFTAFVVYIASMYNKAFFFFLISIGITNSVLAQGIYKWKDQDGVVHYSSEPVEDAKKAKLPEINRGEVKLVEKKLISCSDHGGINCQAGADSDGSVICYDGFTEASPRYRFSCLSPKLSITQVSDLDENGNFSVIVRNSKSVAANKPAVFYKPGNGEEFKLSGPDTIDAFSISEFTFEPKDTDIPTQKADLGQLDLTCANCP